MEIDFSLAFLAVHNGRKSGTELGEAETCSRIIYVHKHIVPAGRSDDLLFLETRDSLRSFVPITDDSVAVHEVHTVRDPVQKSLIEAPVSSHALASFAFCPLRALTHPGRCEPFRGVVS